MKKYVCIICGHTENEHPPEVCPICFADPSKFVEMCPENEHLYSHFSDLF